MPPYSSAALAQINELGVECTYRQLDYWCGTGDLGEKFTRSAPGWRREFDSGDVEVIFAFALIRRITERIPLARVNDIVRARRVSVDGEVLVVEPDGTAYRFEHWCSPTPARVVGGEFTGALVIPLRSFAAVVAPVDGSEAPTGPDAAGAEAGRHRPAAVPATPSTQ